MSVLLSVTVKVKNPEKLKQYISQATATIAAHGGEKVSRGKVLKTLAGNADYQLAVVFRFSDLETLEGWYASPEYQKLIALRDESADMTIVALNPF